MKPDKEIHRLLVLWAADCAAHVQSLPGNTAADDRPLRAIEGARAWVRGEISVSGARRLALDAHAAARDAIDAGCIAAARAAGHAAASAHVYRHAEIAAAYALQAAVDAGEERIWQQKLLPAICKPWMKSKSNMRQDGNADDL